jgi:hypothetical protein
MLECEQLYVEAHYYGGALHRMEAFCTFSSEWPYVVFFFLLFHNTLVTLLWSLVAWLPPSALLSCPRKQFTSAFWQTTFVWTFWSFSFGFFGACVCIHCYDCFLVWAFTNETQVSSPVTHMMRLRNLLPSLWYHCKKWKPKAVSAIYTHTWAFLESMLRKTCDSLV